MSPIRSCVILIEFNCPGTERCKVDELTQKDLAVNEHLFLKKLILGPSEFCYSSAFISEYSVTKITIALQ